MADDQELRDFLRQGTPPSLPGGESDEDLRAFLRGDVGPPGGYASREEVERQRAEGKLYGARAKNVRDALRAGKEAVTNIATYPGRLKEDVQKRGAMGTARGLARGYAEGLAQTVEAAGRIGSHLVAPHAAMQPEEVAKYPRVPGAPGQAAAQAIEEQRGRAFEAVKPGVESVYRGAEQIEPYTGDPTQILGYGVETAGEASLVAPLLAKTIGRVPIIGKPFRTTAEQFRRAPTTAYAEEIAGGVGAQEAIKDVQPETPLGTAITGAVGGTTYVGATGMLRGMGRQTARTVSRTIPGQYRDVLPSYLREKPHRMATRQLQYAIAGQAPTPVRRQELRGVINRIEEAEAMGVQPTLGALSGKAGVTESERLILRHTPDLHAQIQARRKVGQERLLKGFKGLEPAPADPNAFTEYATKRVEDTLQQVEDVVNTSRRGGETLDTVSTADMVTSHGGVVTDLSPRTGQVFVDPTSRLGTAFAQAEARGMDRIQRGGNIIEFEKMPSGAYSVRGHTLPAADSPSTASAVLGRAVQEAHDDIFGEIWMAYDDIAKQAGPRLLYAPKIAKAAKAARFKHPAGPEFLTPEIHKILNAASDPEGGLRHNGYTLREIVSMERRVDALLAGATNEQQIESLRMFRDSLDQTLHDISTSRRKDMADFRPLAQELQQVNNARKQATDTWRSGLASLVQGRDPSDSFKYVLKPDSAAGAAEVRERLTSALRDRPDITPLVEDSILEQAFAESSETLKSGKRVFNTTKLEKFKSKYASTLRQFPELTSRLDNVLEAQRRADELGLPQSYTGKRAAMGTLSSFMDDPSREIDNIMMKSPDQRMREVGKWMSRFQGDKEAIQAFRYQMWDSLVARSARADESLVSGGYTYINPQRVQELIEENRPMLTQLYGADHVKRMEKMSNMSAVMQRMASDQHVTLEQEAPLADAAGSLFMTAIAQIYGKFIKVARGVRTGYRLEKAINNKQSREILAEWYANPSAAKLALAKLSKESEPAMLRAMAASTHLPWLKDLATDDETVNRRFAR